MDGKELARDTYLKLRGQTYYYERRVPKHLVAAFGKTHIRESLGTTDKRIARELVDIKIGECRELFRQVERQIGANNNSPVRRLDDLSDGEIDLIVSEWARSEANAVRDSLFSIDNEDADPGEEVLTPAQVLMDLQNELAIMEEGAHRQGAGPLSHLVVLACQFARIETITRHEGVLRQSVTCVAADQRGPKLKKFREMVRRGWCERLRLEIALRESKRYRPDYADVVSAPQDRVSPDDTTEDLTIGALIERYKSIEKHKKRRKTFVYKYEFIFRLICDLLGTEKRVSTITRRNCAELVELLERLPSNAKKKYPGMTFRQIAEHIDSQPEEKRPPVLNPKTLSSHVYRFRSFFKWAENVGYIAKSPVGNYEFDDRAHTKDDKHPFNAAQLSQIFSASLFTGLADPKGDPDYTSQRTKTRYWVPIIALYHGMRLNEICQLRTDEVVTEGELNYFNLQTAHLDQSLKSRNSHREVPLHPQLRRLGFLDYVNQVRQKKSDRLFPDLNLDGTGYYSRKVGRWFNETFLVDRSVKSEKLSFHSFRHCFQDAARAARIPKEIMEALSGRDEGGTGAKYGDGYPVEILNEEICKIVYDSVRLLPLPQIKGT